ncbi:hypothetical protein PHIN6_03060 [Polynucleobacter sp. HIN6]|uniref:hypothetical protein n=1 Tax=Polynucleobacter sp. HIN6 TaxID=3047865 RepID=UPI00257376C9|nr:hypothetical protein [Polynucleobacter sp. HIN6]BEI34788.1 hypothetical protein PHIN6_03060 [Polynucleobacter sp. HIN6]
MKKNNILKNIFWILLCLISIYRLYLTGDRDIIQLNSPHDEYWYINNAKNNIFGGEYTHMSYIHLPIYSIWLKFSSLIGIPTRFLIDLFWVLATAYLVYSIIKIINNYIIGLLLFIYLIFHPYIFEIFDRALSETLLTVISAFVIASAIEIWNNRNNTRNLRWKFAVVIYVAGCAFGYHTRSEGIVFVVPIMTLFIYSIFYRKQWWIKSQKFKIALPLLIYPFISIITLSILISTIHYAKTGIYARYDLEHPGYLNALTAINKINAGQTEKYVTASKNVLSVAYEESETLNEIRQYLDNESGKMWRKISEDSTGIKGEIANGWFYWALRDAAYQAGWYKDPKYANNKFKRVSEEIVNSYKSGKIKAKSYAISPFLDPDYSKWIKNLPISIINVTDLILYPSSNFIQKVEDSATIDQKYIYTEITGKRREASKFQFKGWIKLPERTLVQLKASNVNIKDMEFLTKKRPDVQGAYSINLEIPNGDIQTAKIKYQTPDGKSDEVMFKDLKMGGVTDIKGQIDTQIGIDSLNIYKSKKRLEKLNKVLNSIYPYIGYIALPIIILGIIIPLLNNKINCCYILFILCTIAVSSRVLLISVIDSSSYNGIQARYILPAIPAYALMLFIGLQIILKELVKSK